MTARIFKFAPAEPARFFDPDWRRQKAREIRERAAEKILAPERGRLWGWLVDDANATRLQLLADSGATIAIDRARMEELRRSPPVPFASVDEKRRSLERLPLDQREELRAAMARVVARSHVYPPQLQYVTRSLVASAQRELEDMQLPCDCEASE